MKPKVLKYIKYKKHTKRAGATSNALSRCLHCVFFDVWLDKNHSLEKP